MSFIVWPYVSQVAVKMNSFEFWHVSVNFLAISVSSLIIFIVCREFLKFLQNNNNKYKYLKNVRGPTPNIFFGNMLDFTGSTADFLATLGQYFDTYGKTIILHDGPMSKLVGTIDGKLLEFILSSTKFIDKADNYLFFHSWLGTGLLTSTGSKWKTRRRLLTPSFHFSILENFLAVFDSAGNVFLKKLEREVDKESVDIYPFVTLYTLDVICEATMGININAQDNENSEYVRSVKAMCSILTNRNFSPLHPKLYPLTWNYFKEKRILKVLHDHTDGVIDKRLREVKDKKVDEFVKKSKPAFLDLLIHTAEEDKYLSRFDIREEVDTFMFEGHDTTASAISFALYSLATNPEVQYRAFEEQISIFGSSKSAKITMMHLQQMKYLDLVIKETLRLYPSVPLIARKLPEDIEYEGTLYPKGMDVVFFVFYTQRHPDYFSNPEKFIPERFLENNGSNPYIYTPFSAGPRNCIGQKFALLEMKCTLSKVLRNFELLPTQPEHKLKLAPEIILLSKNGVNLRLKSR